MADFKDSMEFSALYFHSPLYYEQYDGKDMNYLTFIGVHETAHQWWFEQVANDQAQQPWLDEGLATYSERVYYENIHPDLISTWWSYRVNFFNPQGFIDIPIYDAQGFETYRVSVYLRGAHFFEELRARIGDDAFFAFLQDYLAQERGKIATSKDFFRILKEHTSTDYSDIVRQYFQNIY
jgi:aminopeptidase N